MRKTPPNGQNKEQKDERKTERKQEAKAKELLASLPRRRSQYCGVFMTRRETLASQHEPFGDAFYFGTECVSPRFKDDAARREASGASNATYQSTLQAFDDVQKQ
ncbi:hypothetical protein E4U33_007889, partial [Claviceps sp. LM78 group G4]